ncbi:sugar transporter SWEET1-like isoform X2 [Condylostylus longicornis]|uniref:sugar transporter SWEET1-like isoform X2 n=1 Tax=Condylostylus longicornis TaxID=2530218 RepID=UPI00244E3A7F|nr:sugar transporter SWEET1-like isoform X2 [Condylostylus longicornis]
MTSLIVYIGWSATFSTILQFMSGILICRKYFLKKSTSESSGFPFICGMLSCSLWLQYGFLTDDNVLITVNSVGTVLMLFYVLSYYIFTVNKQSYIRQFLIAFIILLSVILYTRQEDDLALKQNVIGYVCCCVTVTFFGSPLSQLFQVIKTRSTEFLPFPLIVCSFIVSLQWFIYGVLMDDVFIEIPNFLGCLLSSVQLGLFVCYPPKGFTGPSYKLLDNAVFS